MSTTKDVKSYIRSCLISTKGAISLNQLQRDYRELIGDRIPFRQLGCKSLEELLGKLSGICLYKNDRDGQLYVDAEVSEKSAHMAHLISKQKSGNNRKRPNSHSVFLTRINQKSSPRRLTHNTPNTFNNNNNNNNPKNNTNNNNKKTGNRGHSMLLTQRLANIRQTTVTVGQVTDQMTTNQIQDVVQPSKAAVTSKPIARQSSSYKCLGLLGGKDYRNLPKPMTLENGNSSEAKRPEVGSDPISNLEAVARFYHLDKALVTFTRSKGGTKKHQNLHHCKIKVDGQIFSSYPHDFYVPLEAEKYTSDLAVKALLGKYEKLTQLPISTYEKILKRVPQMLIEPKTAGQSDVWASNLEIEYSDRYRERLPANWLEIAATCDNITLERHPQKRFLLKFSKYQSMALLAHTVAAANSSKGPTIIIPPSRVQFDYYHRKIPVLITNIVSTAEVWFQQLVDVETFKDFETSLNQVYGIKENCKTVDSVALGGYYCVHHDDKWWRIQIINNNENTTPSNDHSDDKLPMMKTCFFLDFGFVLDIEGPVYELLGQFIELRAQAFFAQLAGLEDFAETSQNSNAVMVYVGKEVLLEVNTYSLVENNSICPSVLIYYCDSSTSINQDLNALLMLEMAIRNMSLNTLSDVLLMEAEPDGTIYVKFEERAGLKKFQTRLNNLVVLLDDDRLAQFTETIRIETIPNDLYLTAIKNDVAGMDYVRCKVLSCSPYDPNMIHIQLYDCGTYLVLNQQRNPLISLMKLNSTMIKVPMQRFKAHFHLDQMAVPMDFERVIKQTSKNHVLRMKVITIKGDYVPSVKLYYENVCLNDEMKMTKEVKLNSTSVVPSGGHLKKPSLPTLDDFFPVKVPFAVNPWNFFVQPLESIGDLNKLMQSLQECYKNVTFSPLPVDSLVPGNVYASKHKDGRWYRTTVLKVIHALSVAVFFCDFGYYTNLQADQLLPLDDDFLELPYQAIKARLAGVVPFDNNWRMEDCELFKNMVTNCLFSSIVHEIHSDELYKSDLVLHLTLIDTSTDDDINIQTVLIDKKIAKEMS